MNKLSTIELINSLKINRGNVFEVSINNGFFKATHLIYWGGKILYDTGIDSIEVKWKIEEFLENYFYSYWEIEQVV